MSRINLRVGHSMHSQCADCGSPLGDRNALAIDELDSSWCVSCVERVLRRCRDLEASDEHRLRRLEAQVAELREVAADVVRRIAIQN